MNIKHEVTERQQVLVSIIMPVYNSEEYLPKTIDSILSQDFDNFELIAIDDGSTDSSAEILDEYARSNSHIRVLHINNSGMCAARNIGIAASLGEYVMFCDNDDLCMPGYISANYAMAVQTDVDCVRFGRIVERFTSDGHMIRKISSLPKYRAVMPIEEIAYRPDDFYYGTSGVWTGIYRKSFLEENGIAFDERLRHGFEDILFNDLVYLHINNVAFNNGSFYVWKRRESHSASMSVDEDRLLGIRLVYEAEEALFERKGVLKSNPDFCARRLLTLITDFLTAGHYKSTCSYGVEIVTYEQLTALLGDYLRLIAGRRVGIRHSIVRYCLLHRRYRVLYSAIAAGVACKKHLLCN